MTYRAATASTNQNLLDSGINAGTTYVWPQANNKRAWGNSIRYGALITQRISLPTSRDWFAGR